jgi:hypothetical protein
MRYLDSDHTNETYLIVVDNVIGAFSRPRVKSTVMCPTSHLNLAPPVNSKLPVRQFDALPVNHKF